MVKLSLRMVKLSPVPYTGCLMEGSWVILSKYHYSIEGCCPLIWMFMSRYPNNALNRSREKNNLKNIHQKNFEFLAIEIYKSENGLSPSIMNDIFIPKQNIDKEGPQLWNLIPDNLKLEPTIEFFKKKIRK